MIVLGRVASRAWIALSFTPDGANVHYSSNNGSLGPQESGPRKAPNNISFSLSASFCLAVPSADRQTTLLRDVSSNSPHLALQNHWMQTLIVCLSVSWPDAYQYQLGHGLHSPSPFIIITQRKFDMIVSLHNVTITRITNIWRKQLHFK